MRFQSAIALYLCQVVKTFEHEQGTYDGMINHAMGVAVDLLPFAGKWRINFDREVTWGTTDINHISPPHGE